MNFLPIVERQSFDQGMQKGEGILLDGVRIELVGVLE